MTVASEAYHVGVVGASDGGKTTRLREHHETFNGVSVWVNFERSDGSYASGVAGYRAGGRRAMNTAVSKFKSWSDVRINLKVSDAKEGVSLAYQFAVDVWDTVGVPVQIVVDEADNLISKGDTKEDSDLMVAIHEGRGKGVKVVLATQNPNNLPFNKLDSIKYWVWVGEWSKSMEGFINYYGLENDELPSERFQVRVFDRQAKLLYECETKEKYGQ